jgi:16S rRNA (uracil1498-N3)-methyltransferase
LHTGANIRVFDGAGHEHHAILSDNDRGRILLELGEVVSGDRESSLQIVLAQGIARHDRMELILQKAVELGVSTIQPLWLQRSQSHLPEERMVRRMQRWQGIIISACEQCGRTILPELRAPAGVEEWLGMADGAITRLMLQPDSHVTLNSVDRPDGRIALLVGPEGGLTEEERELACAAGYTGIRLGPRILRTETAALVAIAGLQTLWGDYR